MRIPKPGEVDRAVVFFSRGLGDHILALPAMRALGQLFPDKLDLLVSHSAPDLFFGDAGLARIVEIDMDFAYESGRLYDVDAAAALLGPHDLFLSIIPGGSEEWAELARHLRPRWSVGLAKGFARRLRANANGHAVDQAFAVPKAFRARLRPESFAHPFPLPPESVRFVDTLRAALGGRRLLVVHGETKPQKRWAPERFREALTRFLTKRPDYVAIELCRIESALGGRLLPGVLPMPGLPLASAIALAAAADMLLCVDSVFLHAADLWRTPTVALFGPTSPAIWGARFNSACIHLKSASMTGLRAASVSAALVKMAARIDRDHLRPLPLSPSGDRELLRWQ